MAVTSLFSAAAGILTTLGDNLNNNITLSRNAAGTILVNGGAVAVKGGTPTVANTKKLQVFGQGGDDTIILDETNGALPSANLFGGAGRDTIIGGSGGDMIFGQSGNDTLLGKGGNDFLFGGSENDVLTGGDGNDQVFGESGDDRMIWNPGDDTDLFEGGTGTDTAEVNGGGGAEVFTATANGTRVRFDRLDPAPFSLDIGTTENLVVNMNGGDDLFNATGPLSALIKITVDGGSGNDTIFGSNGNDLLLGGDGNDFIDGQQGNDTALLGAGNDTFQWDPGDGSDTVEGQDGTDTLLFNGSNGSELFELTANGGRALFTRNLGNIVMDLNDIETVELNTLGNADTVTVNDLSGTDVSQINIDLAGTIGGTAGDSQPDTVIVNGSNGEDIVDVFGAGTSVAVVGLSALVSVDNTEGQNDTLVVNTLDGDDGVTATTLPAGIMNLIIDTGAGDDVILGSQGADVLRSGEDNDFVFGDNGNDVAELGAGDDVFQWDPGDGNDTIEGQGGFDTLNFFGSNISENVDIVANGQRASFLRNIANVSMDLNDVEAINFRALNGTDNVVVGDLSGTDVTEVNIDLRGPAGGPDGAADSVTVTATQGDDVFGVTGDAGGVQVFGLQATTNVFFTDADDRLTINAFGGNDIINATSLEAGAVQLTINGGLGDDIILGSEGGDLINGGDGNDTALMGQGDDTFVWSPGDDNDIVEGQDGSDTLLFNGAIIDEQITISANGDRASFTRNIANVTMDLNDVETIQFNALGGADTIVVNDMSGTDVTEVAINLATASGGGDGQADTVIVNATNGDDVVLVVGDNGDVTVLGLSAEVRITGFDQNDRLVINTLGGDDVVEASGLSSLLSLTADGGADDDVLVGSEGNDVLFGGEGDDVLFGGAGIDVLDGGVGVDVEIQFAANDALLRQQDYFVI